MCIYRLPLSLSIYQPPSHCPLCGHRLRAGDLVPVASYLLLRGKCRYCRSPIALRYFLVEGLLGGLFLMGLVRFGISAQFFLFAALSTVLLIIAVIDINTKIIYHKTLLALLPICTAAYLIRGAYVDGLLGAATGAGLLGGIEFICQIGLKRPGIGWGDVLLIGLCGLLLGFRLTLFALATAFIAGGVILLALLLLHKRNPSGKIAFAPFLACGVLLACTYGNAIMRIYLSLLFGYP